MKENKNRAFNLKNILKQYLFFIITLTLFIILLVFKSDAGFKAANIIYFSFKEILFIIPPLFILIGLMDVWIPKETIMKHLGEGSGFKGMLLAFLFGTFAAGPLYIAFPIAMVLMRKHVKFSNIIIFLGAWSTTKIPMLLFEISALGFKFAFLRLIINIFIIMIIIL